MSVWFWFLGQGSNKELSNVRANRRSLIRNAATDELEVLLSLYQLCLANGHVPGKDHGLSRLLAHNAGFYGLALALVSNLTRTRSLALQVHKDRWKSVFLLLFFFVCVILCFPAWSVERLVVTGRLGRLAPIQWRTSRSTSHTNREKDASAWFTTG